MPLSDLPEEEPPLADLPEEEVPLVELPDSEIPLTGDITPMYLLMTLVSAAGLVWLTLSGKKREEA